MIAVLALGAVPAVAQEIAGCPVFPRNNVWNLPVDTMPVHPGSAKFIESQGVDRNLHPDFGDNGGVPFSVVPRSQPLIPIKFIEGETNSDPGPYPIPADIKLENGSDAHFIVLQKETCRLYEVYNAKLKADGSWTGYSGAVFNLRSNAQRPDGWTSADASGLAILPGLVRYDEILAGEIRHAIRMTVDKTRNEYVWPARHMASRSGDPAFPPMGQRFRLRASYDISGFDPKVQVLLRALKKYGMLLTDNGRSFFLTGSPDSRWDADTWSQIKRIKGPDLEAVDTSAMMISPNSAEAGIVSTISRQEVPFAPSPVFDAGGGSTISMRLTGNVTSSTLDNLPDGIQISFLICQDESGGREFAWPANVVGGMRVGTAPRTCSAQQFVSDGNALYATSPGVPDLPAVVR